MMMVESEHTIKDVYWLKLRLKIYERDLQKAFHILNVNGIDPILIKGWASARVYPENVQRILGDIDLCVAPEQFDKAKSVLSSIKGEKLNVDLHKGLRHLDTVEWEDLYGNSLVINLEGTEIRILRPEDHLRVLCVHWLTDGGQYKKKLLDIYYLLENRPADFDWERCLNVVSEKRKKWIIYTIGLAHKYFGLDLSGTPVEDTAERIPRWIIKTVEKEWASDVRLQPLQLFLNNRRELFKQLKKRFPPNPITATVDLEGDFDNKPRVLYQIGDIFFRLYPSLQRIGKRLWRK